ncbi:hypothetical protein BC938DRAFT_474918 [Jimgerdemannia flammicorona]|uniref:Uncharacterized protein n=1 Tax=Jimgerdemannia flammicorona TaxID=994334 RepID=A0A433QZG0_9FUNG|nr:hypothetical protein BC938DRAFT_474918 [Jimgerdemannia flammicorona]
MNKFGYAPSAIPLTAAMTGLRASFLLLRPPNPVGGMTSWGQPWVAWALLRSMPAQKARSPAPVICGYCVGVVRDP